MPTVPPGDHLTEAASATDTGRLKRFFGQGDGLLPLWIAEPYVPLAPGIVDAMTARAEQGWYGYERRPGVVFDAFWNWAKKRHSWDGSDLRTAVSPSVGTSIGVVIDRFTSPGDGVILQPPVFTDFKPQVRALGREAVRNPLVLTEDGYRMDLDDLDRKAASPANKVMILCSPHNPIGRVWSPQELRAVAEICARHGVIVVVDEIHADLALHPNRFVPFATAAAGSGARWAATHGPIKTFGLAGLCDTLLITDDVAVFDAFAATRASLQFTRNNVFGVAAFRAGYESAAMWLDALLDEVAGNLTLLREGLPEPIRLIEPEGTYLAWLDLRGLGMDVPELSSWLVESARLALSPGHWFGREGAGFARMTIAAPTERIEQAIERLRAATD